MQFHTAIVCPFITQVTMEIEGEERKVIIVDSEHPLLQVVGDNNCSKADLTQQKEE